MAACLHHQYLKSFDKCKTSYKVSVILNIIILLTIIDNFSFPLTLTFHLKKKLNISYTLQRFMLLLGG